MTRRLERLQCLLNQLFFEILELIFEFANDKIFAWHAAEERLVSTLCHHLNVLKITCFTFNLDHFVKRWDDLDSHSCAASLGQEFVQEQAQAVSRTVFSRDTLHMNRVLLQLLLVLRLLVRGP